MWALATGVAVSVPLGGPGSKRELVSVRLLAAGEDVVRCPRMFTFWSAFCGEVWERTGRFAARRDTSTGAQRRPPCGGPFNDRRAANFDETGACFARDPCATLGP